jgi:hypothetical protein
MKKQSRVSITAPRIETVHFTIRGTAPLVLNKFSAKAQNEIQETQEAGSTAKGKKKRPAKDFNAAYENARHISTEGWDGAAASGFRCAFVSACRLVGFAMTLAKLSIFIKADGYGVDDGTPLVRITKGTPHRVIHPVRNQSGVIDLRARPMWDPGWELELKVQFDRDQFTQSDVANLLNRVGKQVGIGEGRHDSRDSCGMGWGLFEIINKPDSADDSETLLELPNTDNQ